MSPLPVATSLPPITPELGSPQLLSSPRSPVLIVEAADGSTAGALRPLAARADTGLVATLTPALAIQPQAPTAGGHEARMAAAHPATSSPAAPAGGGVAAAAAQAASGLALALLALLALIVPALFIRRFVTTAAFLPPAVAVSLERPG